MTNKGIYVVWITVCIMEFNNAYSQTYDWTKTFGGASADYGVSVVVDDFGNVYSTGYFTDTVDFDPGLGITNLISEGIFDVFVQKLNPSGELIWARSIGGTSWDYGHSIALDASGNCHILGIFRTTVDFDPGASIHTLTSSGGDDLFVLKLSSDGEFIWARSFGGTTNENASSIAVNELGEVYSTGDFHFVADFDPGIGVSNLISPTETDQEVFVQKMDSDGNFLWAKSFGGTLWDEGRDIVLDATGNVYTIGTYRGTADFDPGINIYNQTAQGGDDIFVHKMDPNGNFIWVSVCGGASTDIGYSIDVDNSGYVLTTGVFKNTVDFDPGEEISDLVSNGDFDVFVQKLDINGNFLWARSFGGNSIENFTSIALDNFGNIYTLGNFVDTVDFDPGDGSSNLTSLGEYDVFIQKLDAFGNFLWAGSFGSILMDLSYSITIDPFGQIHSIGAFQDVADFDTGIGINELSSAGVYDVFVQKFGQCLPTFSTDSQTACNTYTWMDGVTYTSTNNEATYVLTNSTGCDSVVTLNLTINIVGDLTTELEGEILFSNNGNATYQWLNCDNNYEQMEGQTSQILIAEFNGNFAVELTENNCTDTSECVSVLIDGVDDILTEKFPVRTYPNPANQSIRLFFTSHSSFKEQVELNLVDTQGRNVKKVLMYLEDPTYLLDLEDISTGAYLLSISTRKDLIHTEIILKQ